MENSIYEQQAADDLAAEQKADEERLLEEQKREELKQMEAAQHEAAGTPTEQTPETGFLGRPVNPNEQPYEGELGRAVVGGVIDIYNSVGSLPKLFDKRFYQADNPDDPYKFDAPWLINRKPIMRTQWGKFVRTGTEMIGGLVGTGKVMWGMKGLKGLATTARATRWGRVGMSAIQGGVYDAISNQSQEQNLARALIDVKPQWAGLLEPIATTEDMSPALRSAYNIGEGLGIGGLFDIAVEGAGWGLRTVSKQAKDTGKKIATSLEKADALTKKLEDSTDLDYALKTQAIEEGAKAAYERSLYRKLKNKGEVQVGIKAWRKSQKPWDVVPKNQKEELMQLFADKREIDWGPYRDMTRRATKQGTANKDLALEQLEFDLATGTPRQNPAYYKGGDVTDNQALSSSSQPVKGVRDMIKIRTDPTQKYGAPRGTLTEANIRRLEYSAPGTVIEERNALARQLAVSPAYQKIYGEGMQDAIAKDLADATADVMRFVNDSGHSRLMDIPQEDVVKFVKSKEKGRASAIEGVGILNNEQLVATDTILGQLLFEARDLSKAALSVAGEVDVAADGSLLDGILSRYAAVSRMRKETSMLSSFNLRRFNSGGKFKDSPELAAIRGRASDAAANEVATLKQLLKSDVDKDLLESFLHFTAASNGNKQTWKDFQTFFKRKLKGYRGADGYQRNSILNEMQTMGVNSMLSGPKTPVRALVGTGLGTIMRPVATILGSIGKSDDAVLRGAYHNVGGMLEARNEAWRKAVADFQSYSMADEGWRGFTNTKTDQEWQAMMQYFDQYGTMGEKAQAMFANSLREINKVRFLNYGPRVMRSMDVYFSQLIARGRQRQLAFTDVYERVKSQDLVVSDQDLADMVRQAEKDFEGKVFSADGQITDEMSKFAADEAKLTAELTGFAKDLDKVFDKQPFLRPFFLFARTGINALKMTSKYTPILNNFIGEHVDIMAKQWDDPDLLKYGIKSANDLEIARATMRGRMAIGYGVTGTAAWMALNGQITGNGPPDRQLKNTWIQNGWQPRSIRIGNAYVSYEALEPFNMFLSFIADTVDAQKVMGDEWTSNQFGKASYLLSANVTNKTFLAGLLQLQDLLTSQGSDAPRVAANFVNNQIPLGGLRNEIGKMLSPGMRELESGFWASIGNRNLWADVITKGEMIPYKYDLLDGSRINDWHPMQRLLNGVIPIQLNATTNPTRELLFRSGLNLKQTFNTGPGGEPLEGHPDLKSKYQFYMGQQNIEKQLEKKLNHPQIIDSIKRMEEDRAAGKSYDPEDTFHGPIIRSIFTQAKKNAWTLLINDPALGGKAQRLDWLHDMQVLSDKARRGGFFERAESIDNRIQKIEAMPIK